MVFFCPHVHVGIFSWFLAALLVVFCPSIARCWLARRILVLLPANDLSFSSRQPRLFTKGACAYIVPHSSLRLLGVSLHWKCYLSILVLVACVSFEVWDFRKNCVKHRAEFLLRCSANFGMQTSNQSICALPEIHAANTGLTPPFHMRYRRPDDNLDHVSDRG